MTPFGQAPAFRLEVEVAPPVPLDPASGGPVRLVAIRGGRVSGGLSGRILPGGADWQTVAADGALAIEARYLLELDDGARVELTSRGGRRADAAGFWSSIWLACADPRHRELDGAQFLARGRKHDQGVGIEAFALPDLAD